MITVTKPYLPLRRIFEKYVDQIYSSNWLTNFGPLEQQLTEKLKEFLQVDNLLLVSNGTLALQVLYRALNLKGEVITSPFSFVATTSSLVWENLVPKFVDINPMSLNLDISLLESSISSNVSGILPVHVFGRACDVWELQEIANKHKLKLIYDSAHAFNVKTSENKNILSYGDASILSFHATKLFHTIEGGAIISKDNEVIKECKKLINFGITAPDVIQGLGTNSKMNEFSAAMGLAVLEHIDEIMSERQIVYEYYTQLINPELLLKPITYASNNFSYFPLILKDENTVLNISKKLLANGIQTRRYFYPSLNTLNYVKYQPCPVSENIASRILCLPMYVGLNKIDQLKIANIINDLA